MTTEPIRIYGMYNCGGHVFAAPAYSAMGRAFEVYREMLEADERER